MIDKTFTFTPFRPVNGPPVYSDHYALQLVFNDLPVKTTKIVASHKNIRWNTNKVGGWEKYSEIADRNEKLFELANCELNEPEVLMNKIGKEMNNMKYVAFGKVKEKTSKKSFNSVDVIQKEKVKIFEKKTGENHLEFAAKVESIDKRLSSALIGQQRESFLARMESITKLQKQKGRSAAVFNLKDDVIGHKKTGQEATILIDPITRKEVTSPFEIRRVSLDYCNELLTNRKPKAGYEDDIFLKQVIHEKRMKEIIQNDVDYLTYDKFEQSYDMIKKKPGDKYKFIIKGGEAVKAALFKVCQSVWLSETLPRSWEKTTLIQLYKGKGLKNDLNNMRHIHLKDEFPKFFGHLVVNAGKDIMTKNLSKFQIATKAGHRAQEHIFVLKSVISLYTCMGKPLILQMWDLSKFFDRENLRDCLNELYRCGIKGKLYRLFYALNKNTRFSVLTPVGLTEEISRGEGLGQGTGEGALISAVNLDGGVRGYFANNDLEVSYGNVKMGPVLFQDDVARMAEDVESAQCGNDKMEVLAETKLLDYNLEKSCFVVIGSKKACREVNKKLANRPLMFCGKPMKREKQGKYLGDWLSEDGLSVSAALTIDRRIGLAKHSVFEVRAVLNDCRSSITGGLLTGITIWESAILPKLLYNAECWFNISKASIKKLENVQLCFYRMLFSVGAGCPISILYWDTGGLTMKFRILKKKLMFLHHVKTLPDDSLAKEVVEAQEKFNLPGLVQECQDFLSTAGINDVTIYSKQQWKSTIGKLIKHANEVDLIDKMKTYKKLDSLDITNESCKVKNYMQNLDLRGARLRFKLRSRMLPTVKANFKSKKEFIQKNCHTKPKWRSTWKS